MFKVAVCNCPNSRAVIEKTVAEFLGNSEFTITEFPDTQTLFDEFSGKKIYGLTVLNQNIMMDFMQKFAELGSADISRSDFDPKEFGGFMTFISDPVTDSGIANMLNMLRQYHKLSTIHLSVSFLTDKGMQSIDVAQILYFEFIDRKVKIKTVGSQYMCNDTLHNVLSLVEKHDFHQPHKSFIVNFKHIVGIKNYNVTMSDCSEIPLSQKKSKEFRKLYKAYTARPL